MWVKVMAQLMPMPLTISCPSKPRLVLPFWCQLTRVVLDRIQEGRKTVVCVCVHVRACVYLTLYLALLIHSHSMNNGLRIVSVM